MAWRGRMRVCLSVRGGAPRTITVVSQFEICCLLKVGKIGAGEHWCVLQVYRSSSCRAELADTNFMLRLQNRGLGARFPNRELAPHRDDQSTGTVTRNATGDCLEKSFEHTDFPDTTLHIHRSQGASARKIRRQRYHAPRPQIPPVRLGNEILVGTFGITFTSSLSFKSVYQKYPPIVRFIFCGTPHDQVIDRGSG